MEAAKIETTNKVVMKKVSEVKPYVRNPRKNDKTVDALVKIIPVVGFNQPILVDQNGVIVKGHARFAAAIRLGMEEVPCVVTDADEEAIRLDRLADNKISELADWTEGLEAELDALNIDFDISDIGFPPMPDNAPLFDFGTAESAGGQQWQGGGSEAGDVGDGDGADAGEAQSGPSARERYEQFLRESQKEAQKADAATQDALNKAYEQQAQTAAQEQKKYVKVVCEKCGHVMFIAEGEGYFEV